MLPNQQVMSENYIYQPSAGISTVSTIPNTTFGSQDIINQYQELMQFASTNASIPMTVTDNKQLLNQIISNQASLPNVMASQVPIKQEVVDSNNKHSINQIISTQSNFSNGMASQVPIKREIVDSNNNNGSNIVHNNGPNNFINNINNNNNNKQPMAIKIVGLKPGENLLMKNIQGLSPGSIYMKTKNGYQIVKIGSAPNGTNATFQATPMAPKVLTATPRTVVPTAVPHHITPGSGTLHLNQSTVSSPTSVASRRTPPAIVNTTAPSTIKTFAAPANSVVSTTPAASAQPDHHQKMIQQAARKLRQFFKYLLIESAKSTAADSKRQLEILIQSITDNKIKAEEFCAKLEVILNAERQPELVKFLSKSIPHFRKMIYLGELTLEGIRAPPENVLSPLQPLLAANKQIFIRTSDGRSIPVSVNGQQPLNIVNLSGTVPSSTVSVPVVNKTMPSATRTVSSSVVAGTTQVRTGQNLLTPAKAQTQVVNALDKLKPVFTPVSGKKIVRKINRQSPAVTASKITQKLPTVVSNVNRQSLPTISNASGLSLPAISNVTGPSLSVMSYENGKKLPVSSPTIQKPVNFTIKIGNISPVNKKKSTISALAKNKNQALSPETNITDLTDIMKLGYVDIEKESETIFGLNVQVGAEERSCEEKLLLNPTLLQRKINTILQKHGLEICNSEVLALVSHATEQRLKDLVEKMAVIAEHRIDFNRADPRYEPTQDVRAQLRFLEDVDKAKREKREAEERQAILKAGKSRSKNEELVKLKEQAKEIQKSEMEERSTRDANLTALQALGPQRKKPRLEDKAVSVLTPRLMRPRIKKVGPRDLIFVLEHEKSSCRSHFLYTTYLKPSKK